MNKQPLVSLDEQKIQEKKRRAKNERKALKRRKKTQERQRLQGLEHTRQYKKYYRTKI